jgi:hypothetical protein
MTQGAARRNSTAGLIPFLLLALVATAEEEWRR